MSGDRGTTPDYSSVHLADGHDVTMARAGSHHPHSPYRVVQCSCGAKSHPLLTADDRRGWREDHAASISAEQLMKADREDA